jgi:hypothetical protein
MSFSLKNASNSLSLCLRNSSISFGETFPAFIFLIVSLTFASNSLSFEFSSAGLAAVAASNILARSSAVIGAGVATAPDISVAVGSGAGAGSGAPSVRV